jgi:hypothetical protein
MLFFSLLLMFLPPDFPLDFITHSPTDSYYFSPWVSLQPFLSFLLSSLSVITSYFSSFYLPALLNSFLLNMSPAQPLVPPTAYSSPLMMDRAGFSGMLVPIYESTQSHIPEDVMLTSAVIKNSYAPQFTPHNGLLA